MEPLVDYSMAASLHEDRLREAASYRLLREMQQAQPSRTVARRWQVWTGRGLVMLGRRMQIETAAASPADCQPV